MAGLTRRVDGIDVYELNDANWPGVADLNVSVGVAKAWHEGDAQDRKFRNFWPAMRDAGLIRGAYLLLAPQLGKTRAQIETMVQHFTDRIDEAGGLEPGDLPPIIDYEGSLPAGGKNAALDQLAWALNKLTPYTQQATGRADLLPIVYTGRATWLTNLQDPTAADMTAYVTHDANAADRLTLDFTRFPLWWAWLANNNLDPLKATDLATIQYPHAWPGPRHFYLQYSGGVPFPNQPAGQPTHDASVIADVDAANTLSVASDFSPLFKLASVAPPTSDIVLSRVTELSDQPPDQVFSLLLIGQGFWPGEFAEVVNQGLFGRFTLAAPFHGVQTNVHARQGLVDIPPLNLLAEKSGKNAFACYFDAGTHADGTGVYLRLRQETARGQADSLRVGHPPLDPPQVRPAGQTLAEYLARLTVKLTDGTIRRATDFWRLRERRVGPTASLIAVLRKGQSLTHYQANKPPDDPRPAELYQLDPTTDDPLPFIAVNVVPFGDWPLVLARAVAQNLIGLADEYELTDSAYKAPVEPVLNPVAPNLLKISETQRQALVGGSPPSVAIGRTSMLEWAIPTTIEPEFVAHPGTDFLPANPIDPWTAGFPPYNIGGFHLIEGGGGFRSLTLRCDRDCLMRRMPAPVTNVIDPDPQKNKNFLPIQSTMRAFCAACHLKIRQAIRGQFSVWPGARIDIDSQRRLFDWVPWKDRKELPRTTVTLSSSGADAEPRWSCTAEFSPAGFRFTDVQLKKVGYWASSDKTAHVLKSVSFEDLKIEFADGTKVALSITDALKPAAGPKFEASQLGDPSGRYQVGANLSLSWSKQSGAEVLWAVDGELSLVLAARNNDVDAGGVMMACRVYPQIILRVRNSKKKVKSLGGTVVVEANNADASDLDGTLKNIANGKLTTSLFCESNWAGLDMRKQAKLHTTKVSGSDSLLPLPDWSWVFDYCNVNIGSAVKFAAVRARSEGPAGVSTRDKFKAWPPNQIATQATIHKLPRQGAYDSLCIHPDRGNDDAGRPIIAAPLCSDLGLHLYWRRGVAWANGPSPATVFRGWGAGRLDQGSDAVLGAPAVPPNQHVDVEVTPAADRSTVKVKYSVTATEISSGRWHVFLEQGLAFAFQYAVETAPNGLNFVQLAWLAAAVGPDNMQNLTVQLMNLFLAGQPGPFDAAVRDVWLSIFKRVRWFDQSVDSSVEQQIPNGPSDPANLENL